MIKALSLSNLKGTSRNVQLEPLTIITGRNHAGKSAILDALTLGFLGHIPALGKTNSATFRLSSGKTMAVELMADDGRKVSRTWTAKGNGVTAKTDGAEDLLPSALAILDPRAFIAANAKSRLAMLAHLAGGDALDALAANCHEWGKRLVMPFTNGNDPLAVAGEMRDVAAAKAKAAKDAIKMHTGTIQGLAQHEGRSEKVTADDRKKAQDAVVKAAEALTRARQRAASMEKADALAEDAAAELETFAGIEHDSGRHERLKNELAAVMEKLNAAKQDGANARTTLAEKRTDEARLLAVIAGRDVKEIGAAVDRAEASKATLDARTAVIDFIVEVEKEIAAINARLAGITKTVGDAQAEIEKLEGMDCCPVCRANAEGWKAQALTYFRRIESGGNHESPKLEQARENAIVRKKELEAEAARLAEELACIAVLDKNREALTACTKLPKVRMNIRDLENDAKECGVRVSALTGEADDIRRQIEQCEKTAVAIGRACELQRIIAERPKDEDMTAAMNEAMNLEHELEQAREAVAELDERARAAEQAHTIATRIQEAQEAIGKETETATQFDALKDEIAAAMAEAIAGTYKPILARAKVFGERVIGREIAVHEDELGYFGPTGFVPFEAMSGTEQTVVTAAIQAALSATAGGFLMLDELSRLDAKNKRQFVANIANAIGEGQIKQAVIVDHDAAAWTGFYTVAVDGE